MSTATSASSTAATPGVSQPLAFISKTDQGGLIAVITALALSFVLVSFGIRGYIRYSNGPWKRDDHIFTAVTILSCIQSAVVFFEISKGLGKVHRLVSDDDLIEVEKAYFANNIFYIIILFLSKCSVGFLYLRLSPVRIHKRAVWAILALCTTWTLISILLLTIDCPWQSGCSNTFPRWEAIGAIDIVTDFILFFVSIFLVKDLHMSWQPKAIVVAAFGTRLLVIAPCALRLYYLNPNTLPTQRNLATSLAVVCTQLQIGYGAMAATFPCLRPFVAVYEVSIATTTASNQYYRAGSRSNFKLTSVNSEISTRSANNKSNKQRKSRNQSPDARNPHSYGGARPGVGPIGIGGGGWAEAPFRPDQNNMHSATVSFYDNNNNKTKKGHCGGGGSSVHSQDSTKMFIERKVDYTVTYDERSLKEDEPDGGSVSVSVVGPDGGV